MTWKRIDANQTEIVQALRSIGAGWIPTSGDPNIGFDGIVLFRGMALIVEIKDGTKPPSARKLTEGEAKRQLQCEAHSVPYLILTDVEQAIKTISGMKKVRVSESNHVRMPVKSEAQVMKDTARTLKSLAAKLEGAA